MILTDGGVVTAHTRADVTLLTPAGRRPTAFADSSKRYGYTPVSPTSTMVTSRGSLVEAGVGVFQSTYNVFLVILVEQSLHNLKPLDATLSPLSIFFNRQFQNGRQRNA